MASTLHTRSLLVAAAFLAGTTLLTACQDNATGDRSSAKTDAPAASAEATAAAAKSTSNKPKGVSGTFTGGTVEYLAPGKHIVKAGGKEQQFFVAEDTKIYGAGTICGKYNPAANTPCTADDLDKALNKGSIAADVIMKYGAAVTVTERPAPDESTSAEDGDANSSDSTIDGINKGKGVSGTWFGTVSYLAPGKYTVSDLKGTEQQFLLAEDTKIWGWGDICGDANGEEGGQGGTQCTEEELEAAAKGGGVSAKVVVVNGIATTITDDH
ncbi:hypothetical protein [Streptomyces sp. NPDC046197]|uniref:hypothetical protein n=1 Tax=Streptomyces sp. NPDC046197 TaxID=3154337 RepID=UPI0033E86CE6